MSFGADGISGGGFDAGRRLLESVTFWCAL